MFYIPGKKRYKWEMAFTEVTDNLHSILKPTETCFVRLEGPVDNSFSLHVSPGLKNLETSFVCHFESFVIVQFFKWTKEFACQSVKLGQLTYSKESIKSKPQVSHLF
jgi:hypothetical protein